MTDAERALVEAAIEWHRICQSPGGWVKLTCAAMRISCCVEAVQDERAER